MAKWLAFSVISGLLVFTPLTAQDEPDEEDANEYELYERNRDRQDFDKYNFPRRSKLRSYHKRNTSHSDHRGCSSCSRRR